jgi:hypothetical protein
MFASKALTDSSCRIQRRQAGRTASLSGLSKNSFRPALGQTVCLVSRPFIASALKTKSDGKQATTCSTVAIFQHDRSRPSCRYNFSVMIAGYARRPGAPSLVRFETWVGDDAGRARAPRCERFEIYVGAMQGVRVSHSRPSFGLEACPERSRRVGILDGEETSE